MPNRNTHFWTGAGFGALNYAARKKQRNESTNILELLFVGLASGGAAILPDVIDRPTGPNHRNIGHSVNFAGHIAAKARETIQENPNMNLNEKDFVDSLFVGFWSHMWLDSMTPAGLPYWPK
jgi:membrane-bound metal-dependent hydrolase YbcI (DUF457 family)